MDRLHLLPMELPPASSINGSGTGRGKMSFFRRLALGCVILAALGLLYVPAYHSAQGPLLGIGETSSPAGPPGVSHFLASVGTHRQSLLVPAFVAHYLKNAQLPGWASNTSRNLNSYIHPEDNTTILNPGEACSPPPYLLVVICSAVGNFKARMAIRNTWANTSNLNTFYDDTVRVAFLLGQSDNDTLDNSIVDETLQYNDIIQERFFDTYNNLTLKSVMMLKWVTTNCQQAKFVMKTDDDMFVNIPMLLKTLKARSQVAGTLIGSLICNARPISDPKNKWYTPKYMFAERIYPNYLSGTGYVMSLDVASKLYEAALATPLLHLEDVYITGVCARRAKLRPVNHPGFSYVPRKLDTCVLKNAITAHKVNSSIMYTIWNKLKDSSVITCTNHTNTDSKKSTTSNRNGRHAGYYLVKRKSINRCV